MKTQFAKISVLAIDIDGTLTDGALYWAGPELGFTQRYRVRDGEAIVRMAKHNLAVVPISRNKTLCARARMQHLKLPLDWLGTDDKIASLNQVLARYGVDVSHVAYIGDGREDVPLLKQVGLGCAVHDGHPEALAAADWVTTRNGGEAAVEEVIEAILSAKGLSD